MVKPTIKFAFIILSSILILACNSANQVDLDVQVKVTLDGKPASQARVMFDGQDVGSTDTDGRFYQRLKKLPGEEVRVSVHKEAEGYRIKPWEKTFVTKLPKAGAVETYAFDVELEASMYFTVVVIDDADGELIEDATIKIAGKPAGTTDVSGEYLHAYTRMPQKGLKLQIVKQGYGEWKKSVRAKPGQRFEIALYKKRKPTVTQTSAAQQTLSQSKTSAAAVAPATGSKTQKATLSIAALTESYGVSRGIAGVAVRINGKSVGKTNTKGVYTYLYKGKSPAEVKLTLSAPGYIPEQWEQTVRLQRQSHVQRYFYPAAQNPIKVGIYGFVSNSPDEDLSDVLTQVEDSVSTNLFMYGCFREVPKSQLRELMMHNSLDMETISTKGWQHTPLVRTVEMIISGSVTKVDDGLTIETTVIGADGKIILSQINKARKKKNVVNTAKLIANSIIDQFPFEGTIAAIEDQGYRINLGKSDYRIRRGSQFRYRVADMDRSGRVKGFRDAGTLRIVETHEAASWAEVVDLSADGEVKIGGRVVRRFYLDEKRETEKASIRLSAKGGLPPDDNPIWGVNVYLNNTWVGTTGSDGKVDIPLNMYEEYDILLSRHGYQPLQDVISIDQNQQAKEFVLEIANALFKVESEPSGADVYVDGIKIGQTPILDGKLVNFGFRKIRLSAGGEYRDWERVVEFKKPEVELIGSHKIVFVKDYMQIGKKAEQNGDIDAAIQAYASTEKDNPDYSAARHRLAQLYMDEKNNFDAAIVEFENVLALPENQQIIYKQFAVTYTNLGHAYYEKGIAVLLKDKKAAAENFAKAIKNLNIAKQNTRFFPNHQFDEAVHDTYYYLALSYHKLYLVSKKRTLVEKANLAWREYFDFFPKNLEARSSFVKIRNSARKYWDQIKDLS
jgi:tetratricopeptide (TPR) repeat protein